MTVDELVLSALSRRPSPLAEVFTRALALADRQPRMVVVSQQEVASALERLRVRGLADRLDRPPMAGTWRRTKRAV